MTQKQRATNFGLEIQSIHGPRTHDDIEPHQRLGHLMVTIKAHSLISKGSMDLLMAAKNLKAIAEAEGLEVDDEYDWTISKPLTKAELDVRLAESQKTWLEGLRQYLWIAADISNALDQEQRWQASGRYAYRFQQISKHLGFNVTPYWEFDYQVMQGYEKVAPTVELEEATDKIWIEEEVKQITKATVVDAEIVEDEDK